MKRMMAGLGTLLVCWLLLVTTQVDAQSALVLVLYVAIQTWAGAYIWRVVVRRRISLVELVGAGLALGSAGAALTAAIASALPLSIGTRPWAWLGLPVFAIGLWMIARLRGVQVRPMTQARTPVMVGVGVGLLIGLVTWLVNVRNYPLDWVGQVTTYHPDMLFFQAVSTSTSAFGLHDSILMSGADLRYHWFAYGWAGQLTQTSGALPFVTLTRVLPLVAIISLVALASSWAGRLSRVRWVPTLAVILIISGGYVGASYGTILNADSPSQSLSMTWLILMSMAFLAHLRHPRSWGLAAVTIVLVAACTGGKISAAVVAIAGMGAVLVVSFIRSDPWRWRTLIVCGSSIVVLAFVYEIFLAGSAEQGGLHLFSLLDKASTVQGLNPATTSVGIVVGTVILVLAIGARWAGAAWLITARGSRFTPLSTYSAGLAACGILTILLVSGGLNDTWFALAASAPLSVLSAVGIGRAMSRIHGRRVMPLLIVCSGLLALLVGALWASDATSHSLRWLGPAVALAGALIITLLVSRHSSLQGSAGTRILAVAITVLVLLACTGRLFGLASNSIGVGSKVEGENSGLSPLVPFVPSRDQQLVAGISEDEVLAGKYLMKHASPDALVATNITLSPLVSALSERQTLISGIRYQAPYGRAASIPVLLDRESAALDFIASPSTETIRPLCEAKVDWLWVDPRRTTGADTSEFARPEFTGEHVIVLRMLSSACGQATG